MTRTLIVLIISILAAPHLRAGIESTPREDARGCGVYFSQVWFNHGKQLAGANPFVGGSIVPSRVKLIDPFSGRKALPFPHPLNLRRPLDILDTYRRAGGRRGADERHSYTVVPFLGPVLVIRDREVIREITLGTGNKPGQFDRDPMPSFGIALSTGKVSMLYSNGDLWRQQKTAAAKPFGYTALFDNGVLHEFSRTFVDTLKSRIAVEKGKFAESPDERYRTNLEPEIKNIMMQMLANNFLGAKISQSEIENKFVPAIDRIIEHIVRDTIVRRFSWAPKRPGSQADNDVYDELTNLVLKARKQNAGNWKHFKGDYSDDDIRTNIKVILAGALEATASLGGHAISHIARNPRVQQKLYQELKDMNELTVENLERAEYLNKVIDETLRLTPSLYFLPRQATENTILTTKDGRTLHVPQGTHVLLDIWNTNRDEAQWGEKVSGYSATDFVPERWDALVDLEMEKMKERGETPDRHRADKNVRKEYEHFGFGCGARVCPGKHLGRMEVALLIAGVVKTFQMEAVNTVHGIRAGVSTKPLDGTDVYLRLRDRSLAPKKVKKPATPNQPEQKPKKGLVDLTVGDDNRLHIVFAGGDKPWKRGIGRALDLIASPFWRSKMSDVVQKMATDERNVPSFDKMLDALNVKYELNGNDLGDIPKEGKPLIAVLNHPRFGVDGLAAASALSKVRSDIVIVASNMPRTLPGFENNIIDVNPMGGLRERAEAARKMRQALKEGKALVVFPAGKASAYKNGESVDYEWKTGVAGLIKETGADILPIHVEGVKPTISYRVADSMLPRQMGLSTLPGEILAQQGQKFSLTIGNIVPAEDINTSRKKEATEKLREIIHSLAK